MGRQLGEIGGTGHTDLDGDGLPEWIFADPYHEGETYILAGFAIPWDDASKW